MKKLILLFAILATTLTSCVGTYKTFESTIPPMQESVELETSKNINYINANEWMVETFSSAESVIEFSDKEAGIVKGRYVLSPERSSSGVHVGYGIYSGAFVVKATKAIITVRVKDSFARIEIQPTTKANYQTLNGKVSNGYTSAQYALDVENLINNFKERMKIVTNDF